MPTPLLALLLAAPAPQEPTALVLEGDVVPGVGAVTRVDNLAVNADGTWLVECYTDHADTDADSVLLRDGALDLREGQALPAPAGATLDSFDAVSLNDLGDHAHNLFLDGTSGFGDDSGVYLGDSLLVQEGDVATAPQLTAGTPYIGFFEARANHARQVIVLASVDDPTIASSVDRAFVRLDLDAGGAVTSQTVLFAEGDLLPGQGFPVKDFDTSPHNFAWNDAGELLYLVEFDGSSADAIFLDDTVVAQEGQPSPVAGRSWSSLGGPELDLSNTGSVVFTGSLDGDSSSNLVVVHDGAVVAQEGSGHPDLPAGATFTSFGTAPVHVSDHGEVVFYGKWSGAPASSDEGLFVGGELVVREGVTTVGGAVVERLWAIQDSSSFSDDGRHLVFEADLAGGVNGAFRIDRGAGLVEHDGCAAANPATLGYGGGTTRGGDVLTLELADLPAAPGALTFLAISGTPPSTPAFPPCGLLLPGIGEVLVDFLPPWPFVVGGPAWDGVGAGFDLPLPTNPAQVGSSTWFQGVGIDLLAGDVHLSDGVELVLQAP